MGDNSPITVRTDSHEHGRHSPGDDEVEEPLGGRGIRDVHGSETGSWDLGCVDPACWAPAELEEPVVWWLACAFLPRFYEMGRQGMATYMAKTKMQTRAT